MDFNPANPVIRNCVQGMILEETGKVDEARNLMRDTWTEATDDFEKFIAAWFVAKYQADVSERREWLNTALKFAERSGNNTLRTAYPAVYEQIAACSKQAGDAANAARNIEIANSFRGKIYDTGPFYHGTKANLQVGDKLTAGYKSNYDRELTMNHIYFTAVADGAGLAAELSKGAGQARVYIVEPAGSFENDPNLTDKKFPGNLTRSYRTEHPLIITGEVADWKKLTPEQLRSWQERLANNKGNIIN